MGVFQVYLYSCCSLEMAQIKQAISFPSLTKNKRGDICIIFKNLSERYPVITKVVVRKVVVGGNRKH